MSWLFAGYAAFFALLGAYIARLVLIERRVSRGEARLDRAPGPNGTPDAG